jgi:hypothetical protein
MDDLNVARVPLTPLCNQCGRVMVRLADDWYCPARRWWNFWRHDRSHNGWLPMRREA